MVVEIVLPGVSPSTAVGTAPATVYGIKIIYHLLVVRGGSYQVEVLFILCIQLDAIDTWYQQSYSFSVLLYPREKYSIILTP